MAKCRINGTVCKEEWLVHDGTCLRTIRPDLEGPLKECLYEELSILTKQLAEAQGEISTFAEWRLALEKQARQDNAVVRHAHEDLEKAEGKLECKQADIDLAVVTLKMIERREVKDIEQLKSLAKKTVQALKKST